MASGLYIETDEAEDVAGSVRHALRCMDFVSEDPQAWKWVILALHSALQGACVCHLATTSSVGALTKRNTAEWIAYYNQPLENSEIKRPRMVLMPLPDLLKAVRKGENGGGLKQSSPVAINDNELNWLTRIHTEFRNQFVHFEPLGWSIEVSGVPEIARLISRIISDIHNCGWAFRHLSMPSRDAMMLDLKRLTEAGFAN